MSITTIEHALHALRAGTPVIVVDDEGRENEGDLVLAAELATAESIAFLVRHTSGYLCAPITGEIADRLELPLMVAVNEDARQTAYTVTVDAADRSSTGISADDRAHTLRTLADPASTRESLRRPGHIVPLRAVDGGVRERAGHTEATVELLRLAGLAPVGCIGELVEDDGRMRRLPSLIAFGAEHELPVVTIEDLIEHLERGAVDAPSAGTSATASDRVSYEVCTSVPTRFGEFRMVAYRDKQTGADHMAIVAGGPLRDGALVRVHSECLTGEALHSLKCECGPQLDAALQHIQSEGGVVVYLRGQEGRGIGLINKLRAYRLQEQGLDTLDANLALGLPADAREYGAAAAILEEQGLRRIRLLTNNPEKAKQLTNHGIEVAEIVPLLVGVGEFNEHYLEAKRDRMGHALPKTIEAARAAEEA